MADLSVSLLFFSSLLLPLLFFSLFLLLSVFHVALPLHSLWPILYFSASSFFFLYLLYDTHICSLHCSGDVHHRAADSIGSPHPIPWSL